MDSFKIKERQSQIQSLAFSAVPDRVESTAAPALASALKLEQHWHQLQAGSGARVNTIFEATKDANSSIRSGTDRDTETETAMPPAPVLAPERALSLELVPELETAPDSV